MGLYGDDKGDMCVWNNFSMCIIIIQLKLQGQLRLYFTVFYMAMKTFQAYPTKEKSTLHQESVCVLYTERVTCLFVCFQDKYQGEAAVQVWAT